MTPAPAPLVWSRTPPDKVGWWWQRCVYQGSPPTGQLVVRLILHQGELCYDPDENDEEPLSLSYCERKRTWITEWAGPIEAPREP